MAKGLVVVHAFQREGKDFAKGTIIDDPALVDAIDKSDHEHHCVRVNLPDPAPAAAKGAVS